MGIDRRAPGGVAVAGQVHISAPVYGDGVARIIICPPHKGVPLQSATAIQLGDKGVSIPRVGVERRAPGGSAGAGQVHIPAPVYGDGTAFISA